jgi:uncharacterized protein DUF3551
MRNVVQLAAMGSLALLAYVATPSTSSAATPSAARYCLNYNEGGTDCGFTSLAQCNATANGIGAECSVDYADDGQRMPRTFR